MFIGEEIGFGKEQNIRVKERMGQDFLFFVLLFLRQWVKRKRVVLGIDVGYFRFVDLRGCWLFNGDFQRVYKEWYLGGEMNEGEKCYSYLCIRVIGYEGEVGFICIM